MRLAQVGLLVYMVAVAFALPVEVDKVNEDTLGGEATTELNPEEREVELTTLVDIIEPTENSKIAEEIDITANIPVAGEQHESQTEVTIKDNSAEVTVEAKTEANKDEETAIEEQEEVRTEADLGEHEARTAGPEEVPESETEDEITKAESEAKTEAPEETSESKIEDEVTTEVEPEARTEAELKDNISSGEESEMKDESLVEIETERSEDQAGETIDKKEKPDEELQTTETPEERHGRAEEIIEVTTQVVAVEVDQRGEDEESLTLDSSEEQSTQVPVEAEVENVDDEVQDTTEPMLNEEVEEAAEDKAEPKENEDATQIPEDDDIVTEKTLAGAEEPAEISSTIAKAADNREPRTGAMTEIKEGKPIIEKGPSTIHFFRAKEPFVLLCLARSDFGAVQYSWLKNGHPFHLNGENRVFRESPYDGNIIFVSPDSNDVGTYQCVAENDIGKVFSHPSLVMLQKQNHQPRGLDLFKQPFGSESNVELVSAADIEAGNGNVFVVLPSEAENVTNQEETTGNPESV